MRAQTATVEAAAKSGDRSPIARAIFTDEPSERPRFDWSEVYTSTAGGRPHAACVTHHGTIIRWLVLWSSNHLAYQRITDPSDPDQWDAWTDSGWHVCEIVARPWLDVWSDPITGTCYMAYGGHGAAGSLGTDVSWTYSTDDGATWAASSVMRDDDVGVYVGGIAGVAYNGTSHVFVALNPLNAYADSNVAAYTGSGTDLPGYVFASPADRDDIRGVGAAWDGGETVHLWLADFSPCRLSYMPWTTATGIFGDSSVMKQAGVGSALSYQYPTFQRVEVETGVSRWLGTYCEISTSPEYERGMVCFTPAGDWLTEEVPWRYEGSYGLEVLKTSAFWYVVQSDRAYKSAVFDGEAEGSRLEFDEDSIISAELKESANEPGSLKLVLDNSDGYLDSAGGAGAALCVRPGSQVALALGYWTTAGRELVWRQPFWVNRVERLRDGKRRVVAVDALDAIGVLRELRARRHVQMLDVELGMVLHRAWFRVCGEWLGLAGDLGTTVAVWQVNAGERWSEVLAKLARALGKTVRFFTQVSGGVGWSSCGVELLDYGQGSSAWEVGGSGSPFNVGRWWEQEHGCHSAAVAGTGYLGESRDWTAVWAEWRDTVLSVVEKRLDTQAEADARATAEALPLSSGGQGGVVRIGLVPGLEVGDVVTCTDELAGVDGEELHVRGLVTRYDPSKGRVEQELELEGLSG